MRSNFRLDQSAAAGWILFIFLFAFLFSPSTNIQTVQAQISTAVAAPAAGPAVMQMTSMTINKTIPAEAVSGLDLRLGGGRYPGCLDMPDAPVVDYQTSNMDLTGVALIATCGWEPDELVNVTLMDPQGKYYSYESKAVPSKIRSDIYKVDFYFQPGVDAPEGKYRFTLQGNAGQILKTHVFFNRTSGARLYAIAENRFEPTLQTMGGKQRLRLNGFLPGEWIRLLVYKFEGQSIQFYAWQDFNADKSGRLIVEVNLPEITSETQLNFYAYGQETHSVHLERFNADGLRVSRQYEMDLFCPGALTPRVSGVEKIKAAAGAGSLPVLQQPGFGSRVTVRVPTDTVVQTYDYPKCIDRAFWWKVSVTEPIRFGWVAESFLGKYSVEAVTQ